MIKLKIVLNSLIFKNYLIIIVHSVWKHLETIFVLIIVKVQLININRVSFFRINRIVQSFVCVHSRHISIRKDFLHHLIWEEIDAHY
jgi:hypothetical protein